MKKEDMEEYRQEFFRLKEKYKSQIDLYIGLEVDYIPHVTGAQDPLIRKYKWDYLVSSIHHLGQFPDGSYWTIDGDIETFKSGLDKIYNGNILDATKTFYQYTCEMIESGGFDIIGHMDKIAVNGRQIHGFNTNDKWYEDLIQQTFRLIAEKNIIVEINTKSYYSKAITFPDIRYFKQLRQLGIPVTVNSDCHNPDKITEGFSDIYRLLREAGFKTVRILTNTGWEDIHIAQISL